MAQPRDVSRGLYVGLFEFLPVDVDDAVANLQKLSGQADDALDVALVRIVRIPKDDYVAARERRHVVVNQLVDEDALAVVQARQHRSALDLDGLHDEDDEQGRDEQGEDQIAQEQTRLRPEVFARLVVEPLDFDVAVVV